MSMHRPDRRDRERDDERPAPKHDEPKGRAEGEAGIEPMAGMDITVVTMPAAPWLPTGNGPGDAFTFYSFATPAMTRARFRKVLTQNLWAEHQRLTKPQWDAGVAATPA